MKIWEPKTPGTLWATPGLLRDCPLLHNLRCSQLLDEQLFLDEPRVVVCRHFFFCNYSIKPWAAVAQSV
jgi:hypothetical protein